MSKKPELRRLFSGLWRVAVTAADAEEAAAAADAFGELSAVSAFEEKPGGAWRVEGLSTESPDRSRGPIVARLALAWLALVGDPPEPRWQRVPATDWLGANQASFRPLTVGRFFIHGSHYDGKIPTGHIDLLIDAATAFGTGEHATTRGCLLALDGLARIGRIGPRVLDMGTGTGVLAMAVARTTHRRVVARDIDAESVRVAAHNVRRNGVASLVAVGRSAGYRDRLLERGAPYDLVMANILARPLVLMARDLGHVLAADGVAVLSGLLPWQESLVLRLHALQRLRLKQRIVIDGWSTLILARGRAKNFSSFRRRPFS